MMSPSQNCWEIAFNSLSFKLLTAGCDSTSHSKVTVLPVHVVSSTARVITQPNTKVLDPQRFLLKNLFRMSIETISYDQQLQKNW